jgi:hypothetical protein
MGSGTAEVPLNDYGTNLGREEKDSYRERKNTSKK